MAFVSPVDSICAAINPSAGGSLRISDTVKTEKIGWYREVLTLEPGSKIFLSFARLLEEMGRTEEAVEVLHSGLDKHPEFIEARLFLIDILHKSGQPALCGAEVARLAGLFREYPGFWEAWSSLEESDGHKPDLSVSLGFLGAMFRNCDITFVDVISAGLKALQRQPVHSGEARISSPLSCSPVSSGVAAACAADQSACEVLGDASATILDGAPAEALGETPDIMRGEAPDQELPADIAPKFSLDVVHNADGNELTPASPQNFAPEMEPETGQEPAPEPGLSSPPPFVFRDAESAVAENSALSEGKYSLRTRSMAEVLAEQGDARGAADIYEELLAECCLEDRPALEARLKDLRSHLGEQGASAGQFSPGLPSASSPPKILPGKPKNGVLDLLEKLAVRLENKARQ